MSSHVIGISGKTGAGKSTLAKVLAAELSATLISWDDFDDISLEPENYIEWYHRGADYSEFKRDALEHVLASLSKGETVVHPIFHTQLKPTQYIVFDAPLGKLHRQTGKYMDTCIHIEVPLDVSLCRRLLRDFEDKKNTKEGLLEEIHFYLNHSRPLFFDDVLKKSADLIVDGMLSPQMQLQQITAYLKDIKKNAISSEGKDYQIRFVDELDNDTEHCMTKGFIAYEAQHGIDVNYRRFSVTIFNAQREVFGVINAYTAFSEIYVDDIWVDSAYQRKGYGKQLLLALENHFKGQGFNNINLVTSAFQAPDFYKKCGFVAEFTRINKKNPKLSKTFFVKFFNEDSETQGILQGGTL